MEGSGAAGVEELLRGVVPRHRDGAGAVVSLRLVELRPAAAALDPESEKAADEEADADQRLRRTRAVQW